MIKKSGLIFLTCLLFFSMVPASFAHTVSPVNTDSQTSTKTIYNWLVHLPNRSENRVISGAFGGYSNDTFSMNQATSI